MALSTELSNTLFEQFWLAGMRKAGSKKITKKTFIKVLLESGKDPIEFTKMLIQDIHNRLRVKQFGFDKQHPRSYLNGEFWDDEVTENDTENKPGRPPAPNRLTPTQRVQAKRAEAAQRRCGVEPMGNDDQAIPPSMDQQGGGGANGTLGGYIDGTFTRAD